MASKITSFVSAIQQQASSLLPGNEQIRKSIIQSARDLIAALETPKEKISYIYQHMPLVAVSTRVLLDLKIFNILSESTSPKTVTELSQTTGADPKLLNRLLKLVASDHIINETAAGTYTANDITKRLADPLGGGAVKDLFQLSRIAPAMPAYLKEHKYTNPSDKDDSPWMYGAKTDLHYFDYIAQPGKEEQLDAFMKHMASMQVGPRWYHDDKVIKGIFGTEKLSSEEVLMIDIGGNTGHDILGFKNARPDMSGRLILQDLPSVVENVDSTSLSAAGIETMPHDMFTPEPVHGAKVYYTKYILHDWPDEQCKQILAAVKPALKKGYSRILLNELVVPDVKADWYIASLDLLMMAVHAAKERTETEWRELVEGVEGLRVVKIWDVEGPAEKVIEIEAV